MKIVMSSERFVKGIGFCFIMIIMLSCSNKARYEEMVSDGLASGERYDSLFLGISLGMSDSAFYTHCWKLNKEEKVYQGGGNMSVLYKMKDELASPAAMEFYPAFVNGKIAKMPVTFYYEGWAPWNKDLSVDNLQLDVLKLLKKWYGADFLAIEHPVRGFAYVKVDGNRQITLYRNDDKSVVVYFRDLTVTNEKEETDILN